MSRPAAWVVALLLVWAAPDFAHGQVFLASRPNPEFTIGPLFVRATVAPDTEVVTLDILWGLVIPPNTAGASVEQDLYLLWPRPPSSRRRPSSATGGLDGGRGRSGAGRL